MEQHLRTDTYLKTHVRLKEWFPQADGALHCSVFRRGQIQQTVGQYVVKEVEVTLLP